MYDDITKIRISKNIQIRKILELVKSSPTDYIMLADSSYKKISVNNIEIFEDEFLVPAIVPFNDQVAGPFGRMLKHINIESNLMIQPFVSAEPYHEFLPFAFIASKEDIIDLLEQCDYSVFLELSLLIMAFNKYKIRQTDDWSASVLLHQESLDVRSKLGVKFGTMHSLIQPCSEYVRRTHDLSHKMPFRINKYVNAFGGRNLILTDKHSSYFDTLMYNNVIVSVNHDVSADYYIALDDETIEKADKERTIAQLTMPTSKRPYPIDSRFFDVSAVFGVKQFSSDISFEPPFTRSTYKILTALELLCFFKPLSILIVSDEFIMCLFAGGETPEAIKKQVFTTKIIEYCANNNIVLRTLGDLCSLK